METHPSFDPAENEILSQLVPEGAEPGTPAGDVPADDAQASPQPTQPPASPEPTAPPEGTPQGTPGPTPAPTAQPTPQATEAPAPQGNVKAALRASRQEERRLRTELQKKDEELERLRAAAPQTDETELTAEELAQMREDFPAQYKAYVAMQQTRREIEELRTQQRAAQQPTEEWTPPRYAPEVQEVIDEVPQLLAWQHDKDSQHLFERAVQYDAALVRDPDWAGKTAAERFTEAARRAEAALKPQPTTAPTPAAPAAQRTDPAIALASAPVEGPKGISDFRGGGPANAPSLDFNRMTDADILASLRPED